MTSKIPFEHLKNKARQTTCENCGADFAVEAESRVEGVRCTKCGWTLSLLDSE